MQQLADLDREFLLTHQLQEYSGSMGPNSNTWGRQLLANAGFSLPYYTVRFVPWADPTPGFYVFAWYNPFSWGEPEYGDIYHDTHGNLEENAYFSDGGVGMGAG